MANKTIQDDLKILETTLRDGSYAINFQFTASDTATIASSLEKAGIELIEIGHGVGLGASKSGKGTAVESDEAYIRAAVDVLTKAKCGVFCIPGVACLDDIDMAASNGIGFIRIGTNVTEVEASEPFITRAKEHGLFVFANFMKSYVLNPKEFAVRAKLTQKYGSDLLTIVDSSGGMLSSDVRQYFHAVRESCDISLAFHGHNNLDLAVSHTLLAAELGAVVVDTTLQGIGRSAGNAATEIVIVALRRMGIDLGIDPLDVMDISEKYVRPLIRKKGLSSLDIVAGYSQFHSSYMGTIRHYSSKYRIDPRKLIMGVSEHDKVNAPAELVEKVAKQIEAESDAAFTARFGLDRYFCDEQNQ